MNTPIQDPIAHACRLLREAAEELKSGHTLAKTGHDWTGEPEAKAAYDEHHAVADALERWAAGIGAGGVEPLRRRECLHQIAEPAAMVAEVENMRKALQFYADGDHFIRSDQDAWDTVSGEPPNYWCDEAGTATVEDGSIAKLALSGHVVRFEDEDAIAPSEQAPAQAAPAAVAGPSEDVRKKIETNTWDHFGDILPTLKAISRGEWYWGANSRCKYIEIRLDTRDGGCILYDRDRVRISPEQFAFQAGGGVGKMEPWPAKNTLAAAPTTQAAPVAQGDALTPGLIAAAEHIEGMASGYIEEHARTEPDTGAVVFDRRDAGLEYHSTLIELADDLRQIAARSQAKEGA